MLTEPDGAGAPWRPFARVCFRAKGAADRNGTYLPSLHNVSAQGAMTSLPIGSAGVCHSAGNTHTNRIVSIRTQMTTMIDINASQADLI